MRPGDAGAGAKGATRRGGLATARLTPRQQRLAQVIPLSRTQTEAAQAAGYSPRSARNAVRRAMRNDAFRAAVQEAQADLMDRLGATREFLIAEQLRVLARCMEGREYVDRRGRPVILPISVPTEDGGAIEIEGRVYMFDAKQANAALRQLQILRGMVAEGREAANGQEDDAIPLAELVD